MPGRKVRTLGGTCCLQGRRWEVAGSLEMLVFFTVLYDSTSKKTASVIFIVMRTLNHLVTSRSVLGLELDSKLVHRRFVEDMALE
jgi:hypothetical protein